MNDLIPIPQYYPLYINLCLFLTLLVVVHAIAVELKSEKNIFYINLFGYILLFFLILYIGQRPIHGTFGDTVNYDVAYKNYALGAEIGEVNDYGWHLVMQAMARTVPIHIFFTVCAFCYIYPLYKISKDLFNEYWYYSFLMFVVSFSFWTYGVNGVRNGVAGSLFLWGLVYRKNKIWMALLFFMAINCHKTLLLPIFAYLATYFYNNPKTYLKGWLACIPLSLIMGGVWITLFTSLGFGDDRLTGYLTSESSSGTFKSTGFRWDFLFHSAFAVFAGWYFIIKRGFKDQFYFQLFNTYLICNGFWILIIKANYSNRFAYLSWFMMAVIIIYPFLKKQDFFKNHYWVMARVIALYFSFTYAMYYLYYAKF